MLKLSLKFFPSGWTAPALCPVLADHAHHADDRDLYCPWEHSHWPSYFPWRLISNPGMGCHWGQTGEWLPLSCRLLPSWCSLAVGNSTGHIYSRLVHPILCKYWLALLWKGSWSQTELSPFPCFFLFSFLAARHFLFFPNLLDSHLYRRYLSPISCSRQIPFASKCIPPAQAKTREVNSTCRLKNNLAFLFQSLSWQLKPLLQGCHMSLLEELQPWAECKDGTFIPYILQMGSLSSGR